MYDTLEFIAMVLLATLHMLAAIFFAIVWHRLSQPAFGKRYQPAWRAHVAFLCGGLMIGSLLASAYILGSAFSTSYDHHPQYDDTGSMVPIQPHYTRP